MDKLTESDYHCFQKLKIAFMYLHAETLLHNLSLLLKINAQKVEKIYFKPCLP